MVNTPIPHSLKSEAKKASKILKEFTVPTAKMGPDKLIPGGIFLKAKGLAIITVVKAGFLVTARGGSGIVIAKVNDGINAEWSAPSAIGIAGLGGGFEIGAEVTDFVIILNKKSAVEAFSKGGNLTLGGNFTIAAGPLGRNLEADVAVRNAAAIYTYSKTRGLFAGISVEGSALIERKDANKKFYGREIRAYEILRGDVDQPDECECLYEVLEAHKKNAQKELVRMAKKEAMKQAAGGMDIAKSRLGSFSSKFKSKKKSTKGDHSSASSQGWDSDSSLESSPQPERWVSKKKATKTTTTTHSKSVRKGSVSSASSSYTKESPVVVRRSTNITTSSIRPRPRSLSGVSNLSTGSSDDSWELRVTAKHSYEAQLPCDLSFSAGEEILVMTRTDRQHDWWEGKCRGKIGIFPANLVRIPN